MVIDALGGRGEEASDDGDDEPPTDSEVASVLSAVMNGLPGALENAIVFFTSWPGLLPLDAFELIMKCAQRQACSSSVCELASIKLDSAAFGAFALQIAVTDLAGFWLCLQWLSTEIWALEVIVSNVTTIPACHLGSVVRYLEGAVKMGMRELCQRALLALLDGPHRAVALNAWADMAEDLDVEALPIEALSLDTPSLAAASLRLVPAIVGIKADVATALVVRSLTAFPVDLTGRGPPDILALVQLEGLLVLPCMPSTLAIEEITRFLLYALERSFPVRRAALSLFVAKPLAFPTWALPRLGAALTECLDSFTGSLRLTAFDAALTLLQHGVTLPPDIADVTQREASDGLAWHTAELILGCLV